MSEDTLKSRMLDDASKRPAILTDCERLIEQEVKAKSGLSGVAIKGGYKVVCKVKPGVIRESMDSLLDDFVDRVEPFWAQHRDVGSGKPEDFASYLQNHASDVADALLGITDDRARRAKNRTMKSAYDKLRPQAKKHVQQAVPGVARMLTKHL
jgi:hypothetical protein